MFAAIVLEVIFVPIFLKNEWPNRSYRSLAYKQLCSALFWWSAYALYSMPKTTLPIPGWCLALWLAPLLGMRCCIMRRL